MYLYNTGCLEYLAGCVLIFTDFPRKFTRGKVSIAITANFKNPGTGLHARVSEIPGVILVRRPELFQEMKDQTGVEFENIVYFRDETHYFIMTAKKKSLLEKGVIKKVGLNSPPHLTRHFSFSTFQSS